MNCELCNDKIVIVPPPTVCFACASTLQNIRATIDRLRTELATWKKAHIELGEMYDRLRAENAKWLALADLIAQGHDVYISMGCTYSVFRRHLEEPIYELRKLAKTAKEGE